jgi:hypothetical protein
VSDIDDPADAEWHNAAVAALAAAVLATPENPMAAYEAPPLPEWHAAVPVTRQLLGRFLQDRATGLVHDVQNAKESCALDTITQGTWFHFWSEIVANPTVDHDSRHEDCMGTT